MRKSRRIAGTVRTRTCCQRNYDNGKSATFVAPAGYARSWGRNISKPMPQVRCVGMDDAHRVGSPANCHHLRCSGRSSCLYRSCERRQHGCASHQSNGSRQRLRRVQRRAVLSVIVPGSARSKVRAFGTKSRRDAHYGVTDQSDQQPEANFRKRPCHHESRYEGQFERRVSRYPELPSRYPTAIGLNDIWTARPEGIDHEKFIHASAKTDQRQRTRDGDGQGDGGRHDTSHSLSRRQCRIARPRSRK